MGVAANVWELFLRVGRVAYVKYLVCKDALHCLKMVVNTVDVKVATQLTFDATKEMLLKILWKMKENFSFQNVKDCLTQMMKNCVNRTNMTIGTGHAKNLALSFNSWLRSVAWFWESEFLWDNLHIFLDDLLQTSIKTRTSSQWDQISMKIASILDCRTTVLTT